MRKSFYQRFVKRPQDVVLSSLALVVLSPVLLGLSVAVRFKLGSPVLFRQERPGLNGKTFNMYKFRSMNDKRDVNGELLPDADRLTSFGKKLRSTSLDELPELINIFKGDMSVVGPRPLLVEYLPLYNDYQNRRHEVKPGLTGLAQISGRNAITWDQKFKCDVDYVNNITFLNDWKIIFKTIGKVLKRDGISSSDSITTEPFRGNN